MTITGTNFVSGASVKFGATAASTVTFVSGTKLTATSPAGTGTVDVTVTTPGGTTATSSSDRYSYQAFVYWANYRYYGGGTTIGRANLDGTNPNQSFITGANSAHGVAVDGQFIYWTNQFGDTIGRANLDGTNPNQSFITGANGPALLVVN